MIKCAHNSLCAQSATLLAIMLLGVCVTSAQEYANVEYLCADWGPAMTLPSKPGEKPHFSDTDEEIYFLKQVTARGKVSIYLCKMKPDGTGKTEIKQLWKNPNYPIDTQGYCGWMNVNSKTRKIALSVLFAGSDETGLWTANLDGTNFKRIITPKLTDNGLQAIDSPSWTPDGRWVAFGETWSGQRGGGRIAKCDANGNDLVYFTGGPGDCQPRVSPDGTEIVYGHVGDAKTGGLYLIGIDGKDQRQMLNPNGKPVTGTYPAWSPDGKKIYAVGAGIIEISTGNTLLRKSPRSINADGKTIEQYSNVVMPHWGKRGLLCSGWGGGITLVDDQFDVQRILADSGKATPK